MRVAATVFVIWLLADLAGAVRLVKKSKVESDEISNSSANVELTVMVMWTCDAECQSRGLDPGCRCKTKDDSRPIRRDIANAFTKSNKILADSKILITLKQGKLHRYNNWTSNGSPISRLRAVTNDPFTQKMRKDSKAHLVSFWQGSMGTCGQGHVPNPNEKKSWNWGYSVVATFCARDRYSFVHEIAHNWGVFDDRGVVQKCDSDQYRFGLKDPNGKWRTVMASACDPKSCLKTKGGNKCTQLPYFSNPKVKKCGLKGTLACGNNKNRDADWINEVRFKVADYVKNMLNAKR